MVYHTLPNTSCFSFHTGKTPQGNDFSKVFPSFDDNFVNAYADFAELAFRKCEA